jgi:site-specific recombinase XerD
MVNSGIDLRVGKILGHADYQSTMHYSHFAKDTLVAAVEQGRPRLGWRNSDGVVASVNVV